SMWAMIEKLRMRDGSILNYKKLLLREMLVNVCSGLFRCIYRSDEVSVLHHPFDVIGHELLPLGAGRVVLIHYSDFDGHAADQLLISSLSRGLIQPVLVVVRH